VNPFRNFTPANWVTYWAWSFTLSVCCASMAFGSLVGLWLRHDHNPWLGVVDACSVIVGALVARRSNRNYRVALTRI